jgi:hypothetical protein
VPDARPLRELLALGREEVAVEAVPRVRADEIEALAAEWSSVL